MFRRFINKRVAVVLGGGALAVLGAVAAFAFFTSSGNGTGAATVGTASAWTVGQVGTTSGGPLYPDPTVGGANVQTNQYAVTNGGAGNQSLANVTVQVANSTGGVWSAQADTNKAACSASDFSVGGNAPGTSWVDSSLAGDKTAGQVSNGTVKVEMIDSQGNQDNCQGVSVPLYFSAH